MRAIMNESLKRENLSAVFCAAADEGCETRAEIAASTGLSIVTVGKAVEEFLDAGIFIQRTSQAKSVGRHAGRIKINTEKTFLVIDISKREFCFMLYDLSLDCTYTHEYEYIDDYSYSENLCIFLHRIKAHMLNIKNLRCCAITLVVSGVYDSTSDTIKYGGDPEAAGMKIREFARTMVAMTIHNVVDRVTAAVKYCVSLCRGDTNTLYINADDRIESRLVIRGKIPKRTAPIGAISVSSGGLIIHLYEIIRCVCNMVGAGAVIIESEELNRMNLAADTIVGMIKADAEPGINIPSITINPAIKYTQKGAALTSRNYWFDRLVN